ncbi:MAG: hypothetical protein ACTSP0_01540 [Alphaproteobacteria bacterium]
MAFGRTALILALVLAPMLLVSSASMAGPYVTAHSRYGNGEVRAPVRAGRFGYQIKLPGGPWIYCENNSLLFGRHRPCGETLRRQTLDFWETMSEENNSR